MSESALPANPAKLHPAQAGTWPMHSGVGIHRYFVMHAMGIVFPATAGWCLFGWRALGTILFTMLCAALAAFFWRRIGVRGGTLRYDQVIWLAGLLALTLPANLFAENDPETGIIVWPILASGAVLLVILARLIQGVGWGKIHPVVLTHLLLVGCFNQMLIPVSALQWGRIFRGDMLDAAPPVGTIVRPWSSADPILGHDAVQAEPASQTLAQYTQGWRWTQQRSWTSLDALIRDRLPPLEDLLLGGQPGPIGSSSAIAVIVGGLFLLYHGLIDSRVPLVIVLSAMATMLILPVPVVVHENNDVVWRWVVMRVPDWLSGWQVGLTLVNYELLAGPLLFTAFFLAPSSIVRPVSRRARTLYALIIGVLAGFFQLYLSVAVGAYMAMLLAALAAPMLDRIFRARTLV